MGSLNSGSAIDGRVLAMGTVNCCGNVPTEPTAMRERRRCSEADRGQGSKVCIQAPRKQTAGFSSNKPKAVHDPGNEPSPHTISLVTVLLGDFILIDPPYSSTLTASIPFQEGALSLDGNTVRLNGVVGHGNSRPNSGVEPKPKPFSQNRVEP